MNSASESAKVSRQHIPHFDICVMIMTWNRRRRHLHSGAIGPCSTSKCNISTWNGIRIKSDGKKETSNRKWVQLCMVGQNYDIHWQDSTWPRGSRGWLEKSHVYETASEQPPFVCVPHRRYFSWPSRTREEIECHLLSVWSFRCHRWIFQRRDEAGLVAGSWRNQRGDCMECMYPSFVRCGNFGDPLRWKELLAFVGDKNAGAPPLTAQEVLSGLYMQTAETRN